jgi:predicted dehydrogenase
MKIGVVGLGSIGRRHLGNVIELGHDARAYDPMAHYDFKYERELYDWCDAAIICTPSAIHTGGLRACVERGKHCLVEKPISMGTGSLEELLKVADEKKLTIMMGNNLRFHSEVQMAKLQLTTGELGKPVWANFICATEFSKTAIRDGVILNSGAHEVDVALHLFGPAVVLTACCDPVPILRPGTANCDVNAVLTERWADFVLQHSSGVRSSIHLDLMTEHRVRQFIIAGTEANYRCDFDSPDEYALGYVDEMKAFVDRIDGHLVPGATGWEGLECLRVLLDIRRKAGLP